MDKKESPSSRSRLPVTVLSGFLVIFARRRLIHSGRQFFYNSIVLALKKQNRVFNVLFVFILLDKVNAGR